MGRKRQRAPYKAQVKARGNHHTNNIKEEAVEARALVRLSDRCLFRLGQAHQPDATVLAARCSRPRPLFHRLGGSEKRGGDSTDADMLRNVLIMAASGIVLFSKEYANAVAQVRRYVPCSSVRGLVVRRWGSLTS